jgi:xylulokinase
VLECDVVVPVAAEYVALGAARQAAWILGGEPPTWTIEHVEHHGAASDDADVYERHRHLSEWYSEGARHKP